MQSFELHDIVEVRPLPGYRLWLRFDDGVEGEVDVSHLVGKGVFAAWNDPDFFAQVYVNPESGTVTWPGDLDLAPDALYWEIKPESRPDWALEAEKVLEG